MIGRLVPVAALVCALLVGAAGAQSRPGGYDALTAAQRGLLPTEVSSPDAYVAAPEPYRRAFEEVSACLAGIVLTDPENGEVLGPAIELIERVGAPTPTGNLSSSDELRLAVSLASGARDRLRRSREFVRADGDGPGAFDHVGPPAIRIELGEHPSAAVIRLTLP